MNESANDWWVTNHYGYHPLPIHYFYSTLTMIKKLIAITNVGKFANFKAKGDLEFCKATLIYAGNGHGKTTLCDIFRSLYSNDGGYISGRETLGGTGKSSVAIRIDNHSVTFKDGTWSSNCSDLLIYDNTFINDNVFAGDFVTHDHKKRLHRVIVGETGVRLAAQVEALDEANKQANRDLSAKKDIVQAICGNAMTVKQFLPLAPVDNLDKTLEAKQHELMTLEQAGRIRAYPSLNEIGLPTLPASYLTLLSLDLADISKDAEVRVRDHLATHSNDDGESWLADGMALMASDSCPFCGQSLDGVSLLASYQAYFSDSYKKLKQEIQSMRDRINTQLFGDSHLVNIDKTITANNATCNLWAMHFDAIMAPSLPIANVTLALNTLKALALNYLEAKAGTPLEVISPGPDFDQAISTFAAAIENVNTYNEAVRSINAQIAIYRGQIAAGDVAAVKRSIAQLNLVKRRFSPEGIIACDNLTLAEKHKEDLARDKDKAKTALDQHTTSIFDKYQTRINDLLDMFNAGFRIADTKSRYVGGTPSSTYAIVINEKSVELGDSSSKPDQTCFRNTLSAGDKSTLALSFFIACTEQDPRLSEKIVIFDDPFTSQDRSRRSCTQQIISTIVKSCRQVIVLSHDPNFLRLIWDSTQPCDVKTLQLSRWGTSWSTITDWDIKETTKGEYFDLFQTLFKFYHDSTGDKRHVAQCIRPLLEQYLRLKAPNHFPEGKWLGDFLEQIRNCDASSPLYDAKACLPELEAINDFSKRYHHATNPSADSEPISDGELQGYVKRTLSFIGSF